MGNIDNVVLELVRSEIEKETLRTDVKQDNLIAQMSGQISAMSDEIEKLKGVADKKVTKPAVSKPASKTDVLSLKDGFEVISSNLFEDGSIEGLQPYRVSNMRYVPTVYQQHFPSVRAGIYNKITDADVKSAIKNLKTLRGGVWSADFPGVMLDIEAWSIYPFVKGGPLRKSMRLMADICKRFSDVSGQPVSMYNAAPLGGIVRWMWVGNGTSVKGKSTFSEIQAVNDIIGEELVPSISFLTPQLYTYYNVAGYEQQCRDDWVRFAEGTISEAKRIAPDLPCLPVLWHEMHNGGQFKDFRDVPKDYWHLEWKTVKDAGADGAIWWGGYNMLRESGEQALESIQENQWALDIVKEYRK